jgi:hypothetical protein
MQEVHDIRKEREWHCHNLTIEARFDMNYETFETTDDTLSLSLSPEEDVRFHYDGDVYHACEDFLEWRRADWTEPHGEICHEQWWDCQFCGECFSEA